MYTMCIYSYIHLLDYISVVYLDIFNCIVCIRFARRCLWIFGGNYNSLPLASTHRVTWDIDFKNIISYLPFLLLIIFLFIS